MSILAQVGALFQSNANRYPELYLRWMKAFGALERLGYRAFPMHVADHYVDALLRSMEDERVLVDQGKRHELAMVGETVQFALSRQWLLSTYEILRTVRATPEGKVHPTLLELYNDFRLVRVPMAKQEIAEDHRLKDINLELVRIGNDEDVIVYSLDSKAPYTATTIIDETTGSIGWRAIDLRQGISEREVFRRDLSDRTLSLLESISKTT